MEDWYKMLRPLAGLAEDDEISTHGIDELDENISKAQKEVGQLGSTEKVKKNSGARGKLVGANESTELAMLKNLSGIK